MNTKHTPGPWEVKPLKWRGRVLGIFAGGKLIADTSLENREANARLIASAPDLLAALGAIMSECSLMHKYWGENCNSTAAHQAEEMAKAAIRKAKGE